MIKQKIEDLLKTTLIKLDLPNIDFKVVITNNKNNGDYASNLAFILSKQLKEEPLLIAENIKTNLETTNFIKKIEVAPPGFINFYINKNKLVTLINEIIKEDINYGCSNIGLDKKVNIEFASVNPTGQLHLGHARGAAYGDNLCRIFIFNGYNVTSEYYINDRGQQIENLGLSIQARYQELCGLPNKMPEDGYYGFEIKAIAEQIYQENKQQYQKHDLAYYKDVGLKTLLNKIKTDLSTFRVNFTIWSSEQQLYNQGRLTEVINKLNKLKATYKKEGAVWLKTAMSGDEKDRVLIKSDGEYTYLTPDLAYHLDKFDRGYDYLINVFGADHHGYVPRLKAGVQLLGYESKKLEVKIVQMVRLLKGKEEIKMSKRAGKTVTLNELIKVIGVDATRYFFAMRNINTQMDFDLELAVQQTKENPYYYVAYAHARICSILNSVPEIKPVINYETIEVDYAYDLLLKLQEFKDVVISSAQNKAPHLITNYLTSLATTFHLFYTKEKILGNNSKQTNEYLQLIKAVKIVLRNGLNLIGVKAPERM